MTEKVKRIDDAKDKARQAADAAGKVVQERLDSARQTFSEVAEGLGKGAGRASVKVKETATQVSGAARERYGVAAEKARQGYDRARKDLDNLSGDLTEYVRDNPGKAVLIAAGVGFLVGLVFRGRGRD